MKKIVCCLILIGLALGSLSACSRPEQAEEEKTERKTEPWEMFIGRWDAEGYEISEGIFTNDHQGWLIRGTIRFRDEADVEINICAVQNFRTEAEISNDVQMTCFWEVNCSGRIIAAPGWSEEKIMEYKNDRLFMKTPEGTFILRKGSDDPHEI